MSTSMEHRLVRWAEDMANGVGIDRERWSDRLLQVVRVMENLRSEVTKLRELHEGAGKMYRRLRREHDAAREEWYDLFAEVAEAARTDCNHPGEVLDAVRLLRRERDAAQAKVERLRAAVEGMQERLVNMLRTRNAMLVVVERCEDALWKISAGGCEYTGVVACDLPCYRRTDCDDPCPACIARVALEES